MTLDEGREMAAMANGLCYICGVRPATVRAQVVSNGQRQTLEMCDVDYWRLARQQGRSSSPLEALFGGGRGNSLFDDFFNDDFWGARFPSRPAYFKSPGSLTSRMGQLDPICWASPLGV